MTKSISKNQKITEELVRKTLENHIKGFLDLYSIFFPKHFWQNRNTSWQKECDEFFKSFKNQRDYFKENYKKLFFEAAQNEIFKKQLSKDFLKNKDDLIFEKKVFISGEKIITLYCTLCKNETIGIAQIVNFDEIQNGLELNWNESGLLEPSSTISCFCIKTNGKYKNF